MRVLVTGAGGFSGGHVARRLAEAGFETIAVTRRSPVAPPVSREARKRFSTLQTDLASPKFLPDSIDAIVHAAATSIWTGISVERMIQDNVLATQAVVRYALAAGARTFIFFSSLSAFGRIKAPMLDETTPAIDPDAYGATKLLGEQLLRDVAPDLPSLSLRLPSVIGLGSKRNWPSETLRKLRAGEPLSYFNPDASYNNAVHEADLSTLIASLLDRRLSGADMVVLGAAGRAKVKHLVELMAAGTDSASEVRIVESKSAPFMIDCTKACREYEYAPMDVGTMFERFVAENVNA